MQATDVIFHFLVVTLKMKIIQEINLNNLFYLTQYIRPTSNPYKKLLRSFLLFFYMQCLKSRLT